MTHAELVERAVKWLRSTKRCRVVIAEMSTQASEEPDAIGWYGATSFLVECKASMSDYRADLAKPHRRDGRGMGRRRYYFAEPEIASKILADESKPKGWGVVAAHPKQSRILLDSGTFQELSLHGEINVLLSALCRISNGAEKTVSAKLYTHEAPNPRAEIHVVQTETVPCPYCSVRGTDGSYGDGTPCHHCKGHRYLPRITFLLPTQHKED